MDNRQLRRSKDSRLAQWHIEAQGSAWARQQATRLKYYYNITVFIIILDRNAKVIGMCKEEAKCDLGNDLKGCALKHISEARKLISKGKF